MPATSDRDPAADRHERLVLAATDPRVGVMGRVDRSEPGVLRFGYPGVTLRVTFQGTSLRWRASGSTPNCRVTVVVDGTETPPVRLGLQESEVVLVEGLSSGRHTVDVVHRTETWQGIVTAREFLLPPGSQVVEARPWPERKLLFIGDSVTCGEGVDRAPEHVGDAAAGTDGYHSYGLRLARALHAQGQLVCYGGRGLIRDWQGKRNVQNAPQFFDLALAAGDASVRWDHGSYVPDLVVVSLGTNDFNLALGPLPERESFVAAYVSFLRKIRSHYPRAKIVLTEGAIVNDEADPKRPQKTVLRQYIAVTIERLADPDVVFIASKHYPGDATNAHPTGEQHAAMAKDFERPLATLMGW